MNCDRPRCNLPAGHDGPHGVAIPEMPGIVLAPWGGGGETVMTDSHMACDMCGGDMAVMERKDGRAGGEAYCRCGQHWCIDRNGGATCAMLTMYPRNPTAEQQLERLALLRWRLSLLETLGFPRNDLSYAEIDEAEARYRGEIADRRWWQRLGLWIVGKIS